MKRGARTEKSLGLTLLRLLFRSSAFRSTGSPTFSKVLGVQPREERLDGGLVDVSPAEVEDDGGGTSLHPPQKNYGKVICKYR